MHNINGETNICRLDKEIKYACNKSLQLLVFMYNILLVFIFYYCVLKRIVTMHKQETI